ncbi:hypothetical protein JG688_00015677 [Phytophthora aleatoria]|uniref:Uncharacterized protein n=1 Tax=Phytophthora aleatoria TaxID=2496075 RepID=A0A8J5ISU3_9STRA|nr:hypothetical protein JG688_00015677 [Phytophthora aleatoria]
MPANSPFSSFSPSPLSPPQAVLDPLVRAASSTLTSFSPSTLSQPDTVVDLRVRPSPISDGSTKACGADQAESDHEEEQPSDFGGDFDSNYAEQESNTDADESPSHDSATAEPPTLRERRVRQRFGPEEDYLLVVQTWARDVSAVSSGTALSAKRLALDWSAGLHTEAVSVPVECTSLEDADVWDDIMLSSEAVSTGRSGGGAQRTEAWHLCEAVQHNTDDVASNRSGGAAKTTGRIFALVWGDAAMSWARRCTTLYTKVVGFGAAWR